MLMSLLKICMWLPVPATTHMLLCGEPETPSVGADPAHLLVPPMCSLLPSSADMILLFGARATMAELSYASTLLAPTVAGFLLYGGALYWLGCFGASWCTLPLACSEAYLLCAGRARSKLVDTPSWNAYGEVAPMLSNFVYHACCHCRRRHLLMIACPRFHTHAAMRSKVDAEVAVSGSSICYFLNNSYIYVTPIYAPAWTNRHCARVWMCVSSNCNPSLFNGINKNCDDQEQEMSTPSVTYSYIKLSKYIYFSGLDRFKQLRAYYPFCFKLNGPIFHQIYMGLRV